MSFDAFEPARWAMGDTVRYAERMDLIQMRPRGDLSSTGFALAHPGHEYLVLEPSGSAFTVTLEPGTYSVEWFSVGDRETAKGDGVIAERDGETNFTGPFGGAGSTVLYLKRVKD
jgi:hypothetical protein